MILLSNFSSVFELSVAIHLAYSLLREVHNRPIARIEKLLDRFKGEYKEVKEKYSTKELSGDLVGSMIFVTESRLLLQLHPHQKLIKIFTYISVSVACLSIGLLILSGYIPNFTVTNIAMVYILCSVLLPMPSFVLATMFFMRNDIKEVEESLDCVVEELCWLRKRISAP